MPADTVARRIALWLGLGVLREDSPRVYVLADAAPDAATEGMHARADVV